MVVVAHADACVNRTAVAVLARVGPKVEVLRADATLGLSLEPRAAQARGFPVSVTARPGPGACLPGPRPRWGIGTRSDAGDPTAPVVVRVSPGTPAAAAGLLVGDRITPEQPSEQRQPVEAWRAVLARLLLDETG